MKKCLYCEKELIRKTKNKTGYYCNSKCQGQYNRQKSLSLWKEGKNKGYRGKTFIISNYVRDYLFEKYNNKCVLCGWNKKHPITGKIPLEVNHIDGNPGNNIENNLELICPNCHSLTTTFRNLGNRKSCRIR